MPAGTFYSYPIDVAFDGNRSLSAEQLDKAQASMAIKARVGRMPLTFAVKDVFALRGVQSCFGNPTWLREHPPAQSDAEVVLRLLGAGASLRGP